MELELVPKETPGETLDTTGSASNPMKYVGPERRKAPRRITVDRREMVRFENTPDRRQNGDRRVSTRIWDGRDI